VVASILSRHGFGATRLTTTLSGTLLEAELRHAEAISHG